MLGAIAGDIIGSYWELRYIKRYDIPLLMRNSHFTDDTVMTLAVAKWLMESPDHSNNDLIYELKNFGKNPCRTNYLCN